jgi:hypothetical protein
MLDRVVAVSMNVTELEPMETSRERAMVWREARAVHQQLPLVERAQIGRLYHPGEGHRAIYCPSDQ